MLCNAQRMKSATGEPTFAVFAFANMMLQLLEKYDPDVFTVAFDTPRAHLPPRNVPANTKHNAMHSLTTWYRTQLERIKQLVELMGLAYG